MGTYCFCRAASSFAFGALTPFGALPNNFHGSVLRSVSDRTMCVSGISMQLPLVMAIEQKSVYSCDALPNKFNLDLAPAQKPGFLRK